MATRLVGVLQKSRSCRAGVGELGAGCDAAG